MVKIFSSVAFLIGLVFVATACSPSSSELWNADRTGRVVAVPGSINTQITAFLLQKDGTYLEIDLSAAEDSNFGQLGRHCTEYDRFETKPVEWVSRQDDLLEVRIETQAWRAGQRYTASESLIFRQDGTTVWR